MPTVSIASYSNSSVKESNRAAIGARVTIRATGVKQFSEVRGGASYLSQNDLRLHFGLGTAKKMESVEIRWPNGKVETLENVAADAIYTIVEGSGIRTTTPLPRLRVEQRTVPIISIPGLCSLREFFLPALWRPRLFSPQAILTRVCIAALQFESDSPLHFLGASYLDSPSADDPAVLLKRSFESAKVRARASDPSEAERHYNQTIALGLRQIANLSGSDSASRKPRESWTKLSNSLPTIRILLSMLP